MKQMLPEIRTLSLQRERERVSISKDDFKKFNELQQRYEIVADTIFANACRNRIAGKIIAEVPVYLLAVDESYQRKVNKNKLVKNWDYKKCSLLLVSYRKDERKYYIIDGYHRYEAAIVMGLETLPCEILYDLSIEEEAELFATQDRDVTKVSVVDKYKAGVVCKEKNAMAIKNMCDEYGIIVSSRRGVNHLVALSDTYTFIDAKIHKEDALRWIFGIYMDSHWNAYPDGLNVNYIRPITYVYNNVKTDDLESVYEILVNNLQHISPKMIITYANLTYDSFVADKTRVSMLFMDIAEENVNYKDVIGAFNLKTKTDHYDDSKHNIKRTNIKERCVKRGTAKNSCSDMQNRLYTFIARQNPMSELSYDDIIDGSRMTRKQIDSLKARNNEIKDFLNKAKNDFSNVYIFSEEMISFAKRSIK